jgi:thiol-disulfide isomerase/thioredoxin
VPTRSVTVLALLMAFLATACGATGSASTETDGSPGSVSQVVAGHGGTLDGTSFDSASLDGTPVVLWFWAPWCTICRVEAPEVAGVAAELAASETPVTVIGVPGQGERAAMEEFVASTSTSEMTHLVDADGTIWNRLGVLGQPAFAFTSADGRVDLVNGSLGEDALRERALELVGAGS